MRDFPCGYTWHDYCGCGPKWLLSLQEEWMKIRARLGSKFERQQIQNPVESEEWIQRERARELKRNECAFSEDD